MSLITDALIEQVQEHLAEEGGQRGATAEGEAMNFTTDRERLLFELDEARHRYRVAGEDCERAFAALRRIDPHFEAECPGCPLCEAAEAEAAADLVEASLRAIVGSARAAIDRERRAKQEEEPG